jgi:hypothetical protein
LNEQEARYVVVGGFAIRAAGYDRRTMDIDLLIESSLENEARVIRAVSRLPDAAAKELEAGEIARYVVVRVADEIVVDLMQSASGVDYEAARPDVVVHEVNGVSIPFASPELLWKMKKGVDAEGSAARKNPVPKARQSITKACPQKGEGQSFDWPSTKSCAGPQLDFPTLENAEDFGMWIPFEGVIAVGWG